MNMLTVISVAVRANHHFVYYADIIGMVSIEKMECFFSHGQSKTLFSVVFDFFKVCHGFICMFEIVLLLKSLVNCIRSVQQTKAIFVGILEAFISFRHPSRFQFQQFLIEIR